MKKTMKTLASATLSALTLLGPSTFAHAGSDLVLIRTSSIEIGTVATPFFIKGFLAPGLNQSPSGVAVLHWSARDVDFEKNAVYINPTQRDCRLFADGSDPNASRKVTNLQKHSASAGDEQYSDHKVVATTLLNLFPATNSVMICPRDSAGLGNGPLDILRVSDIVLHYNTTP